MGLLWSPAGFIGFWIGPDHYKHRLMHHYSRNKESLFEYYLKERILIHQIMMHASIWCCVKFCCVPHKMTLPQNKKETDNTGGARPPSITIARRWPCQGRETACILSFIGFNLFYCNMITIMEWVQTNKALLWSHNLSRDSSDCYPAFIISCLQTAISFKTE